MSASVLPRATAAVSSIVLERPQMIVASVLGAGALAFVPGHLPPLSRSSPISLREPLFGDGLRLSPAVMQFDEVTKRADREGGWAGPQERQRP